MSGRLLATRISVACAFVAQVAACVVAQAQVPLADPGAWEHLGPEKRATIDDIVFTGDPGNPTVWAYSLDLLKLVPPGTSWTFVSRGARGPLHFDLFGSPPDTIFVGRVLWRSTDGGQTFHKLTSPTAGAFGNIAAEGALDRIPAGAPFPGRLISGDECGFLYSDDAGNTWSRTETTPYLCAFQVYAFRTGRVLAAGFYGAALSDDGARTFRAVPQLYETAFIGFDLTEKAFLDSFTTGRPGDSAEGRILLLGTQAGRPKVYLWASDDEGTTWHEAHAFDYDGSSWGGINAVPASAGGGVGWAVATSGDGSVYATTDGGETWTAIGQVPETGRTSGTPTFTASTAVGPDGRLYAGVSVRGNTSAWSWITKGRIADAIRVAVASEEAAPNEAPSLGVSVRPNPAGGRVEVVLSLAEAASVRVSAVDALGREVALVFDGPAVAGERVVGGDTSNWSPGVYVVRAVAGGRVASARLVVAR